MLESGKIRLELLETSKMTIESLESVSKEQPTSLGYLETAVVMAYASKLKSRPGLEDKPLINITISE